MLSDISNKQLNLNPNRNGLDKGKINNNNNNNRRITAANNSQTAKSSNKKQNTKPKRSANANGSKSIEDAPSYKFHQHYERANLTMFPYLDVRNIFAEDDIDFTESIRFPRNNARKYNFPLTQPTEGTVDQAPSNQLDPIQMILRKAREESHFEFGNQEIHIESDGSIGFKPIVDQQPRQQSELINTIIGTPSGSKRPIDHVDALMTFQSNTHTPIGRRLLLNNSTPSSLQKKLLSSITKKRRHERLDNSRVISARAIMKMVDDSLISSDSEIYSNMYTNSLSSIEYRESRSNNIININADDIDFAKWGDIENDDENMNKTPSNSKTINMHNIVVNNNLRNLKH